MKKVALILLLMLSCYATGLSQSGQPSDPPPTPPSSEYSLKTWVEYQSSLGKYKARFPKAPKEFTQAQPGIGGEATVYIAEHKGLLLYVTTYADNPSPITDAKASLSRISEQWLEANSRRNPTVVKNEEGSYGNYPSRFLMVETQRDVVRVRWIMVKDRIYYQFVAAPKHQNALESENGYEKLAMSFLNAFELIK